MVLSPKKYRANLEALTRSVEATEVVEESGIDLQKHPSGIIPKIVNMIASVDLPQDLDLLAIAEKDPNTLKYLNDSVFKAGMIRIPKPRATTLLFPNGKVIVTGSTDEKELKSAAKKANRRICKIVNDAEKTFKDFRILTIVAQCDCGFKINLDDLAEDHEDFITRDPSVKNAILYQVLAPRVKMVIWSSGKILLIGSRARENITKSWEAMYPVLLTYKEQRHFTFDNVPDDE